ncbi:MAG: prepilin-type N-terminal cleavage/methylation domain-containing protein [Gemmatimonadaceae bacterium]|nr:prepilin-type N-terminal cleavage/methylation domain-containing protein [Gemmatimonadaceae bacterium]
MRVRRKSSSGFTLIELIASITIIAILAAVALPRVPAAIPFAERGYADGIAASLRQSRAVALASGCAVQFTVDAAGYRAFQHAAAGTHCALAGAWSTPVRRGNGQNLDELNPAGVVLGANRQFVFAADGSVAAGPVTIAIGPHVVTVDATGIVQVS